MCGRFTLTVPGEEVAEAFGLDEVPELVARYNIAPTQPVAVVRSAPSGGRRVSFLRWGLVPSFTREPQRRPVLFNARAETLGARPAFRAAWEKRRCLIPADGFYEWEAVAGERTRRPHLVRAADGRPFAFAGLWEWPHPADPESPGTCTIVTTEANGVLRPIHDRMPVILPRDAYAAWLDLSNRRAVDLLRPAPDGLLTAVRVGPAVNRAAHDAPDCLLPV
jgi:putative SOS response-associated peptidase YedK